MDDCDLLVSGGLLVDAHGGVREDHALAVSGNRIIAVDRPAALTARYQPRQRLDASDRIVVPGLVNAHTHASATLFRGYAPDVAGRSFFERMWRIEALLTDDDVRVGALAGCLEMIRNGVTGFANHFSHMDQVARAVEQSGMRAGLSRTMLDRGDDSAAEREVAEGLALSSAARAAVTDHYQYYGVFPANNNKAGIATAPTISGDYVISVTIAENVITIRYGKNANAQIFDKKIALTADATAAGSLVWTCASDGGIQDEPLNGGIQNEHLPAACE